MDDMHDFFTYVDKTHLENLSRDSGITVTKLDDFLKLSGRDILIHAGKISHDMALQKAHGEYEKFRQTQLSSPTAAEKDFVEAEKELKQIESAKKRRITHGEA
jgi:hypothetical protein